METGSEVRGLGYLGIEATDGESWEGFAGGVLGMEVTTGWDGDDQTRYLKMDERSWRIAIHPGEQDRLAYVGWEVGDAKGLERLAEALDTEGIPWKVGEEGELRRRRVSGLLRTQDPAGTELEFFWGAYSEYRFRSPHGVEFRTGSLGLGHMILLASAYDLCLDFYQRILGFRLSDWTRVAGSRANFLRCNARHHSLALADVGLAGIAGQDERVSALQHIMVEVTDIDDVGRALDRCQEFGVPLTLTLGRHANDQMFSFYMRTPSGFDIEYGYGGRTVNDQTWVPMAQAGPDIWGHHIVGGPDIMTQFAPHG